MADTNCLCNWHIASGFVQVARTGASGLYNWLRQVAIDRLVAKASVACKCLWQVTYATGIHQTVAACIDNWQMTRA